MITPNTDKDTRQRTTEERAREIAHNIVGLARERGSAPGAGYRYSRDEAEEYVTAAITQALTESSGQGTDGACCEAMREKAAKECERLSTRWRIKATIETNEVGNVPNKRKLKGMAEGAIHLAAAIRALPIALRRHHEE